MANEAAAPVKGGKKSMMIWVILAVIAVGAGGALPWLFGPQIQEYMAGMKKTTETHSKKFVALTFDDVVVNLGEERLNRYLRVKLLVWVKESESEEITESLAQHKAYLKNWVICYLSDQSPQEVTRRAGVNRIRREICDQFNLVLYPNAKGKIVEVLFDMFVVQ